MEVNGEIGTFILDSRHEEDNLSRKERYHCYSLDAVQYAMVDFVTVYGKEDVRFAFKNGIEIPVKTK